MNDNQILEIVNESIEAANAAGENWADQVDSALLEAGFEISADQPDGSDAWEIIRLADGRMVYLSDESAKGANRYSIA